MKNRQWMVVAGVILLSALLAIPLRGAVQRTIIIPAAYIWWGVQLFYRATPQLFWWILIVALAAIMIVSSLLPEESFVHREPLQPKPPQGPVESLALWMVKARGGVYFKWLIAHRLGNLAHQMLSQRETRENRSVFAPLIGRDWTPSKSLQNYLEAGLHGSFADYPQVAKRLVHTTPTPLDQNVADAVDFLESQFESLPKKK